MITVKVGLHPAPAAIDELSMLAPLDAVEPVEQDKKDSDDDEKPKDKDKNNPGRDHRKK